MSAPVEESAASSREEPTADRDARNPVNHTDEPSIQNLSQMLDTLGIRPDEYVGLLRIKGNDKPARIVKAADVWRAECDMTGSGWHDYFGVNPTTGPARNGERGKEEHVTRVVGLQADLDVKPGACKDFDTAYAIIDVISASVGARPTVVISSGGGLQPIWALDGDCSRDDGIALLRRFGRLVKHIGGLHGAKLDSVFDASRVLRIPGSRNWKPAHGPEGKAVTAVRDTGGPLDPATLSERLDECNVPEDDDDRKIGLGEVQAAEADWKFARETCGYAATVTKEWLTERVTDRHHWLLSCFVRLQCMRRNGCITRRDYDRSKAALVARFEHLCATQEQTRKVPQDITLPDGKVKMGEVSELHAVAVERGERKTPTEVDKELGTKDGGGHVHLIGAQTKTTTPQKDAPPMDDQTPQADAEKPAAASTEPTTAASSSDFEADVNATLEVLRIKAEAQRRAARPGRAARGAHPERQIPCRQPGTGTVPHPD
jgi:hypothetical protein